MGTFLFNDIIFGPVQSRRLGISLGINLLPTQVKVCNYDCIYCECGWTARGDATGQKLPDKKLVMLALEEKLTEMKRLQEFPDTLTFAGNGEPTLHPDFKEIIKNTIRIRDEFSPEAKIAVLSNATTAGKKEVYDALCMTDKNILKLDTVFDSTFQKLNRPPSGMNVSHIIENLKLYKQRFIMQIMMVRGHVNGENIDNTTAEEQQELLHTVEVLQPSSVMLYTIARETPAKGLQKIPLPELQTFASRIQKLSIPVHISG